jgi:hypothetical protein
MEDGGKKRAKPEKSKDGEAAKKTRKKVRKAAKAEEQAAPAPPSVEPQLSKKERKAARAAAEGKADPATRQAATEAFLAAREAAKAQAQSEAQAAKAEKEVQSSPPVHAPCEASERANHACALLLVRHRTCHARTHTMYILTLAAARRVRAGGACGQGEAGEAIEGRSSAVVVGELPRAAAGGGCEWCPFGGRQRQHRDAAGRLGVPRLRCHVLRQPDGMLQVRHGGRQRAPGRLGVRTMRRFGVRLQGQLLQVRSGQGDRRAGRRGAAKEGVGADGGQRSAVQPQRHERNVPRLWRWFHRDGGRAGLL